MSDCPFKRQCEIEAIFWQRRAAEWSAMALLHGMSPTPTAFYQRQAAHFAKKAMQNLFAII